MPIQSASLTTLPTELLLELIPHIPYTPQALAPFCQTSPRFDEIIQTHEHSLVRAIAQRQYGAGLINLFPGLTRGPDCCGVEEEKCDVGMHAFGPQNFGELDVMAERLETLDEVHGQWLKIVNHGVELQWLKRRWEGIHKVGLLLLYRIQDSCRKPALPYTTTAAATTKPIPTSSPKTPHLPLTDSDSMSSYISKTSLLHSLPAPSLACILFKLISSIKILRVYGPEPIHGKWARGDLGKRSDVELACEELLLKYGPEFFIALLRAGEAANAAKGRYEWAIAALQAETASILSRQQPFASGDPKPPTLISSLRRALAREAGCAVHETVGRMWEILSAGDFDFVGESDEEGEGVLRVLGGLVGR